MDSGTRITGGGSLFSTQCALFDPTTRVRLRCARTLANHWQGVAIFSGMSTFTSLPLRVETSTFGRIPRTQS
jgi:hypothetical protein